MFALPGQPEKSIGHHQRAVFYRQTVQLNADHALAHNRLRLVFAGEGKSTDAITHLGRSLELKGDLAKSLLPLAWLLVTHWQDEVRQPKEAVQLAHRAVEVTRRKDSRTLDTLSAACAAAGDFDQVVVALSLASQLLPPPPGKYTRCVIVWNFTSNKNSTLTNSLPRSGFALIDQTRVATASKLCANQSGIAIR